MTNPIAPNQAGPALPPKCQPFAPHSNANSMRSFSPKELSASTTTTRTVEFGSMVY
jgi:hypothetical protein